MNYNIPIVVVFIYYIFFVVTVTTTTATTTIGKQNAVAFLVRTSSTTTKTKTTTTDRSTYSKPSFSLLWNQQKMRITTNIPPIQPLFRHYDNNKIVRRKHHNNIILYNSETNYNSLPSSSESSKNTYSSESSSIVNINSIEYKSDESELDMLKNLLAQLENNSNINALPIGSTNHNNNRDDDRIDNDDNNNNSNHLLLFTSSSNNIQTTRNTANIDFMDVPRPTINGGYSHTSASRAKISAANRGKVPWNKGKQRSDEVRLRIAAGVRAKNRERFLLKLIQMNITEEQYEQQQIDINNIQQAERLSRRTVNGGYRPTEETKLKISKILKEKYANGEIKLKQINTKNGTTSVYQHRKGFHHSDITKQRISDSLKNLWKTNETYRINMINKSAIINSRYDVRQKIRTSLREKWNTNSTYREYMITAFSNRTSNRNNSNDMIDDNIDDDQLERIITLTHRERISLAMKEKWKNETYRTLALAGITNANNKNKNMTTTDKQQRRSSTNTLTSRASSPKIPKNMNNKTTTTKLKVSNPMKSNNMKEINNRFDNNYHSNNQGIIMNEIVKHNMNDDSTDNNNDVLPIRILQPLTQPRTKKSKNERKQRSASTTTIKPIQLKERNNVTHPVINHEVSQRSTRSSSSSSSNSSSISSSSNLNGYLEGLKNLVDNLDIEDTLIHQDDDDDDRLLMEQFMEKSITQQKTSGTKSDSTTNKKSSSNGDNGNGENNAMGNVNRLQEERPDLYELLYGFEEDNNEESSLNQRIHSTNGRITGSYFNNNSNKKGNNNNNNNNNIIENNNKNNFIPLLSTTLGDENFDPYGLEDY